MGVFGLLLVGLSLSSVCWANLDSGRDVFTENGRPIQQLSDEELADQFLARGGLNDDEEQPNMAELENLRIPAAGDVDEQRQNGGGQKQEEAIVHKREGQAEFATFVDPVQNRRLIGEKHVVNFEKRARVVESDRSDADVGDTVFIAVTTVCSAAAVFGLIGAAFVWKRVQARHRLAGDSEYPHYGVTGPSKERSGPTSPVAMMDAKLASSAHLYHYQHTKQQIIAMEQSTHDSKGHDSDDSEGEEDEGDFSVYEYPGLAPTGDIEVTNPLFENAASPKTKTDPKLGQLEPAVHERRSHEDQ